MRLTRAAACRAFAGCLLAVSLSAPALAQQPATVLDLAAQHKHLTIFVAAVHTAGLDSLLAGSGPLTVYAPTDEAFAKLPASERESLLSDAPRLKTILLGHIVQDAITMQQGETAVTSGWAPNAAGRQITFALDGERTTVGGAHLVQHDLRAGNGAVNTIDKVLLP